MIHCRNCQIEIIDESRFCNSCGAQIVKERISITSLLAIFFTTIGWESNFFLTLRYLLYKPQVVFKEYIKGTRKKFANPFSFYAVIIAISLLVFSNYSDQLIEMTAGASLSEVEIIDDGTSRSNSSSKEMEIFGFKNETEFRRGIMKFQLKYYNLFSFLLLPIYTLIAFLVFRKPYNFGEHLIVNTYLQAITTLFSVVLFGFSIISGINVFGTGIMIVSFLYYCFTYQRLYELTLIQLLLKTLKFIGLGLLIMLIPFIIGIIAVISSK